MLEMYCERPRFHKFSRGAGEGVYAPGLPEKQV